MEMLTVIIIMPRYLTTTEKTPPLEKEEAPTSELVSAASSLARHSSVAFLLLISSSGCTLWLPLVLHSLSACSLGWLPSTRLITKARLLYCDTARSLMLTRTPFSRKRLPVYVTLEPPVRRGRLGISKANCLVKHQ